MIHSEVNITFVGGGYIAGYGGGVEYITEFQHTPSFDVNEAVDNSGGKGGTSYINTYDYSISNIHYGQGNVGNGILMITCYFQSPMITDRNLRGIV